MANHKYDIFISYRHEGGAQYARTLQLMLEKYGYHIFLDYDELRDGPFSPKIEAAIKQTPIYMIVLSKGSMSRCVNEGDWVRKEIEIAVSEGKRIIPVNPDNTFDGIPDDVPSLIKEAIGGTQYSEINFGQTLNATVDLMVKNRIKPYVCRMKWKPIAIIAASVLILALAGVYVWQWKSKTDIESLKNTITFNGQSVRWAKDINKRQLLAVKDIFESMQPIDGGEFSQGAAPYDDGTYHENVELEFETPAFLTSVRPFYINQFEVSLDQWNAVMNDNLDGDPDLPVRNVTFTQAQAFADALSNLTTMDFRLPTESEWEFAAKGSNEPEGFMFAGSDDPGEVAWYSANSGGFPQSELPGTPTVDDLFNMSGNVSEWCDTDFKPYDDNQPPFGEGAKVIRGGNYDSEEYEITVTHRVPGQPDTSLPTLGFRIALSR